MDIKRFPSSAIYAITEKCNFACDYCYTRFEDYIPDTDSIDVFRNLIEIMNAQAAVRNDIPSIHFFGGEPLVAFQTIQEGVSYGNKLNKKFRWSMTTNACLLTPDVFDWCMNNGFGNILFSIDGPEEVHNAKRKFHDGSGTFDAVMKNVLYIKSKGLINKFECRGTTSVDTVSRLADSYKFLYDDIGFGSATVLPALEEDWNDEKLQVYEDQLTEVGAWFIENMRHGRELEIHQITDGIRQLVGRSKATTPCGLGDRVIGVTAKGLFVSCHRLATRQSLPDEWILGDVFNGWDVEKFERGTAWDQGKRKSAAGYDCSLCPANDSCTGMCIASNWDIAGRKSPDDRYTVAKSICDQTLIHFRVGSLVWRILRDNQFFIKWLKRRGLS